MNGDGFPPFARKKRRMGHPGFWGWFKGGPPDSGPFLTKPENTLAYMGPEPKSIPDYILLANFAMDIVKYVQKFTPRLLRRIGFNVLMNLFPIFERSS
jgi:hypothetical protein